MRSDQVRGGLRRAGRGQVDGGEGASGWRGGGKWMAGRGQVDGEERRDGTLLVKWKKYDARVVDILIVRGGCNYSIGRNLLIG